ncbi:MAG: glutamyl-tRNA reductase [Gemmatimonadales bacterium]
MLISLSLEFRHTSLETRERFRLSEDDLDRVFRPPADRGLAELLQLSTCNRIELYGWTDAGVEESVDDALARLGGLWRPDEAERLRLLAVARRRHDAAAAAHMLRIAAGLESQILGDAQILGQVRRAYRQAVERGSVGRYLHRLFQTALRTGRRVRFEAGLAAGTGSIGGAAIDVAWRRLGSLEGRRCVVVGCGKTGAQAARRLALLGVTELVVVNRTLPAAAPLVPRTGARLVSLAEVYQELSRADLAIVATGADRPLIAGRALALTRETNHRSDHPLLILDLSMPRNVEPAAGRVPGVTLLDLDGLGLLSPPATAAQRARVAYARRIVTEELAGFQQWLLAFESGRRVGAVPGRRAETAALAEAS